jgi:hypothetical protein
MWSHLGGPTPAVAALGLTSRAAADPQQIVAGALRQRP